MLREEDKTQSSKKLCPIKSSKINNKIHTPRMTAFKKQTLQTTIAEIKKRFLV